MYFQTHRFNPVHKFLKSIVCLAMVMTFVMPPGNISAQQAMVSLPVPGTMLLPSATFTPAMVQGITVYPDNPFEFDFIVNPGDNNLKDEALRLESDKLIKYFLTALTVPEEDLWVNLSPYEEDRIIPDSLAQTEMGRDLLMQDYLLKQLTASLVVPEDELGKKFWNRVQKKIKNELGVAEIPANLFSKVWIVPEKAVVYEHETSALVLSSHLKVMFEEDYLAMQKNDVAAAKGDDLKTVMREMILPEIEKEINTGKSFAPIRQIYNSMVLATWFKQTLKESLLGQVYVDQSSTKGIETNQPNMKEDIYNQYMEAFKVGVYNMVKEDYDPAMQAVVPRKYVTGGTRPVTEVARQRSGTNRELDAAAVELIAPARTIHVALEGVAEEVDGDAALTTYVRRYRSKIPEITSLLRNFKTPFVEEVQARFRSAAELVDDPYKKDSLTKIIRPEKVFSAWVPVEYIGADGKKYTRDAFVVRSRNNRDNGPAKGGIRQYRAADLFKNGSRFSAILEQFNELGASVEDVKMLIENWLIGSAVPLSMTMVYKTLVVDLPLGGGKGDYFGGIVEEVDGKIVVRDDPNLYTTKTEDEMTEEEFKRLQINNISLAHVYGYQVTKAGMLKIETDNPAGDVNVGGRELAGISDGMFRAFTEMANAGDNQFYSQELYAKLKERLAQYEEAPYQVESYPLLAVAGEHFRNDGRYGNPTPELGVISGIPDEFGGVVKRNSATGDGGVDLDKAYWLDKGDSIKGKRHVILGAGNASLYAAIGVIENGGIVEALSNSSIAVRNTTPQGFSLEDVEAIRQGFEAKDQLKLNTLWAQGYFADKEGYVAEVNRDKMDAFLLQDTQAEVLMPGDIDGRINPSNVELISPTFEVIVELANSPIKAESEDRLYEKNPELVIIPDTLANAGGVTVSNYHMLQSYLGYLFAPEEIDKMREGVLIDAYNNVIKKVRAHFGATGDRISMRQAFDLVGADNDYRNQRDAERQKKRPLLMMLDRNAEIMEQVGVLTPENKKLTDAVANLREFIAELPDYVDAAEIKTVGGVNLNPALLDMEIKRDENGMPFPAMQQPIMQMDVGGFILEILNVMPAQATPLYSALKNKIKVDEDRESAVFDTEKATVDFAI